MSINSRQKGARGEREFAKKLKEFGYEAERGCQHSGGKDSPDVKTNMNGVHWEVKRTERLRLDEALAQSKRDAGEEEVALVAYKKNFANWVVIMDFNDFMDMYKAWEREQINEKDKRKNNAGADS